jgi:hypothetical protein
VKYLHNKKGPLRGEGDRFQNVFFAVGAIVVMIAIFVIGLQVGRVIERGRPGAEGKTAREASDGKIAPGASDIRKDLGGFSKDAISVPIVPPPNAKDAMGEVEKSLTFRETLSKKEDSPAPLERAASRDNTSKRREREGEGSAVGRGFLVQIGAYRDKGTAESYRKKMEKSGFQARTIKGTGKSNETLYKVLVGPFPDKEGARKARRRIKNEMNMDTFLVPG